MSRDFLSGGMTIPKLSHKPMDMYDTIVLAKSIFHNHFLKGITARKWSNSIQAICICFHILYGWGKRERLQRWQGLGFGIALGHGVSVVFGHHVFIGETGDLRPLIFLGYLGLRQTWGTMPLRVAVSWDAEVNKVLFSLVMILCTETCHHRNHLTSRTLRNGTYRPHSVCGVILNPTHGMIPHSHMSFALKIADVQVAMMPTHQRSVSKYSIEIKWSHDAHWRAYFSGALTKPSTSTVRVFYKETVVAQSSKFIRISCLSKT